MSSSGSGEARPPRTQRSAPAEQHLGDRLAAFVDGELTDDSRDRVLAHLATCPQCKAAATEQRRLKSVVAQSELPAISAGLLARLQGLPGMGTDGADGGDGLGPRGFPGPGGTDAPLRGDRPNAAAQREFFDTGLLGSGSGMLGSGREEFSYLAPSRDLVASAGLRSRGFRIHELRGPVAPPAPDRGAKPRHADPRAAAATEPQPAPAATGTGPASRGRRFAFAAAGAFSMAAIAIGGALPMDAAVDGGARPDDGPAVSPLSANTNTVSDTRGVTPRAVLDAEERQKRYAPPAAASASSVALARPLLAAGSVPLLTGASGQAVPQSPARPAAQTSAQDTVRTSVVLH